VALLLLVLAPAQVLGCCQGPVLRY
jgi:hypothetical protein